MINKSFLRTLSARLSSKSKIMLFVSIIGLFCLYSCSADVDTEIPDDQSQLIESAKAVFESTCVEQLSLDNKGKGGLSIFPLGEIVPDWSSAVETKSSSGTLQSVDVMLNSTTYRYRAIHGNDDQVVRMDQKMVVIRRLTDEAATCYILFYLPTNEYANKHKDNLCEKTTNFSVPESYSGLKIWTHLDGSIVRVNKYQNGNCVSGVSFLNVKDALMLSNKIGKLVSLCGSIKIAKFGKATKGGQMPENTEDMENFLLSMGWQCINGHWYDGYNNYVGSLEDAWNKFNKDPEPDDYDPEKDANPTPPATDDPKLNPELPPDKGEYEPITDDPQEPLFQPDQPTSYQLNISGLVFRGYRSNRFDSWAVAKNIIQQLNYTPASYRDTTNYIVARETNDLNNHYLKVSTVVRGVVRYIINTLYSGAPVLVGLDYRRTNLQEYGATIDSWAVIYGYNYINNRVYFDYIDAKSSRLDWAKGEDHRFVYNPLNASITGDQYVGDHNRLDEPYYIVYIVRTI